jgi:hypothetical protein
MLDQVGEGAVDRAKNATLSKKNKAKHVLTLPKKRKSKITKVDEKKMEVE